MEIFMGILLFVLAVICSALFVVHRALTPHTKPKGKTNIPGPTEGWTWPILGDVLHFNGVWTAEEMLEKQQYLCRMRDKAMSFWAGSKLIIFITDADIMEKFLDSSKCLKKDADLLKPFREFFKGLFSVNGKEWAALRRPLDKHMHPRNIDAFFEIFERKATQVCNLLDGWCDKGEVDVKELIAHFTFDTFLETAMGAPSTQMTQNTLNFPEEASKAVQIIFRRMFKLEYKFDWIFKLSRDYQEQKRINRTLQTTSRYIQDMREKEYAAKGVHPGNADFEPANYTDVLVHRARQENWSQEELDQALLDVIVGGSDTSSIAVATVLLFLAQYPEYQNKAYQEQVEIMGDSLEAPTPDEISRMDYLQMVFNESLRITGPPSFVRTLTSETVIDGLVFPEGASLIFCVNEAGMKPKYWEKPQEFYPDHFLPEAVARRPKCAYGSFGSGLRVCPGKRYALSSSKFILSMLLRRFHFSTRLKFEEMTYNYLLMRESKEGYPLTITRRTKSC